MAGSRSIQKATAVKYKPAGPHSFRHLVHKSKVESVEESAQLGIDVLHLTNLLFPRSLFAERYSSLSALDMAFHFSAFVLLTQLISQAIK
jgi:hypothetical protein